MPLQKQNVPLSLNQGVNTKVDPKQMPFGSFSNLENIVFDKEAEFNKRPGYDLVSTDSIGRTSIQNAIGIAKFKEQPLWISKDQIYSYSASADVWKSEGSYDSVVPESKPIVQNGLEQTNVLCEYIPGFQIFGWLDTNQFKLSILDENTNAYVLYDQPVPDTSSTNTLSRLKMTTFQNRLYLTYVEFNSGTSAYTLYWKQFDVLGYIEKGQAFSSTSTTAINAFNASASVGNVEVSANGNGYYDIVSMPENLLIGYHKATANELILKTISDVGVLGGEVQPWTSAISPEYGLELYTDPNNRCIITMIDGSYIIKMGVVSAFGLKVYEPVTIENTSTISGATGAINVTTISSDSDTYTFFYQIYQDPFIYNISTSASAVSTVVTDRYTWNQYYIRKRSYTISNTTLGAASNIAHGVGLASKAYEQDINTYINVVRETELNDTYYVMKADGSVQAKIAQGSGGPLLNSVRHRANDSTMFYNYSGTNADAVYRVASLPSVPQITSEKFLFASNIQGKIVSGTTGITSYFALYGVNSSVINFSNEVVGQSESIGENLHFAGGQLRAYDGNVLVEENFNYSPESLIITAAGSGGYVDNGVHLYYAIYSWTDAQGNIHRSGLSLQGEITNTSNNVNTIKIPCLNLSQKTKVYVELYRTAAGGTIFYKTLANNTHCGTGGTCIKQTFAPFNNQETIDFIQVVDLASDADISGNEILYTTGGVLENLTPPSSSIVASFKNRLFLAGLENKLEIRYSKLLQEKVGVEFNDSLFILVSQVGGDIVALKGMDDKLIIFKENAIFYLAGDGPNNLGQQDSFIEPQLISSDVGCSVTNSVVLTPQGLFFKSAKGIYLLSRSLGLEYIGAPVDDFNHLTITKADMVAKSDEVRFLTSDGVCLVYNYFRGLWTTFSNHRGLGAAVINNLYYYINSQGASTRLYKQNYSKYDDAGTAINLVLETGWMNPIAAQNSIRVYRMLILGQYFSPHRIKVSVAYDYDDTYVESSLIDVTSYTESYEYGFPGVDLTSTGLTEGYYGDPGGTTGDYTTAIAYGGKDVMQYQMRVNFKKQKCEAMKIKIETLQGAGQLGRGVNLSQLLFVAGAKGTDWKVKQSRVFKTT